MKDVIRERLAAGESPEEVKAYFARSYGEYILLKPEARGVSLLVYVLPALALLGGALLLWRLFGKWTRPAVATGAVGTTESAPAPDAGSGDTGLSEEEEAWLRRSIQEE
jgi:cytochrome c-type biogenesis protein CcmH